MILVTGATGTVGREVVAQLLSAGERVRALTRDSAAARFDPRVIVAQGDLTQSDTLARALDGVDRIFSIAVGPHLAAHEANLAAAAVDAGVRHIVKLSVLSAGQGSENALVRWHDAAERAIQSTGLAWTFVRPGMFMSNGLRWVGSVRAQGKVFWPYGSGRVAPIHPRDIAAVAVAALTGSGHEGKAYGLTGPESLKGADMVATLAEVIGRPLECVAIGAQAARESMLEAGLPAAVVDATLEGISFRPGEDQATLPTVEQVLGRQALCWRAWAREHAGAFV